MKPLRLILACSALSLMPLTSLAQTASNVAPDVNTVTVSGIGVPRHPYPMGPDEFYKFKGSYDLANGQTLSLFNRGRVMFAKIGGQARHSIVAASPDTFVAKDHMMKIRFDPAHEDGDRTGELFLVAER
ncbi:MAG: hypothetical protein JO269_08480 [Burkholderiaceae bacterium]|nr:hypothetical protein [Burkholderiaceae bacterium]